MRTINATLKSELESGSYEPFFEIDFSADFAMDVDFTAQKILNYKIKPTGEFEATATFDPLTEDYSIANYIVFRRGIVKNGVQYPLETSTMAVSEIKIDGYYLRVKASVIPTKKINVVGDTTYWNVVQAYCAAIGMTATRNEAAESFWDNQFLPTGKDLALSSAEQMRPLLKQKYLMNFCDSGNNEILFFSAKNLATENYTITLEQLIEKADKKNNGVGLTWRNDLGQIYKGDEIAVPYQSVYNLGYIKDGDVLPIPGTITNTSSDDLFFSQLAESIKPINIEINLEYLTGDRVKITSTNKNLFAVGYLLVTEYFDNKISPSWGLTIELWDYIGSNEGGTMPSTTERVVSYAPLITAGFDRFLSTAVTNIQALTDWINDFALNEDLVNGLIAAAKSSLYPVGSIYTSVVPTNPAALLGFGTWSAFGTGRTLVGIDPAQTEFDTVEEIGGEKTHTLTIAEMPAHAHTQDPHNHTQDPHTHTQNSHNHLQDAHTHTQNSHNHLQDVHTHTQNSHNHLQDAHTHTQDSHNHLQDPHNHTQSPHTHAVLGRDSSTAGTGNRAMNASATGAIHDPASGSTTATNQAATATNQAATATNQNTTATNQAATATNQNATATNQAATATNQNTTATNQPITATNQNATATNQAATATNQNTGGGGAHNNLQPYIVVYMWKRTA